MSASTLSRATREASAGGWLTGQERRWMRISGPSVGNGFVRVWSLALPVQFLDEQAPTPSYPRWHVNAAPQHQPAGFDTGVINSRRAL